MKMLLCCDVISLVKRKHKNLKMQRSLSAKRVMFNRPSTDSGRYSMLSHTKGKQSNFYYERDAKTKMTRVNALDNNLNATPSSRTRKSQHAYTCSNKVARKSHCAMHQPDLQQLETLNQSA